MAIIKFINNKVGLKKTLNWVDLVILGIGAVIGAVAGGCAGAYVSKKQTGKVCPCGLGIV